MNLQRPNSNESLQTGNRSRDVAPQSGVCSRCIDGCRGGCDMFHATFRGRELLSPHPFGSITAGADKAFRWLQKKSMDTRKSMREIADAIIISQDL